jgi:hypothetical protein
MIENILLASIIVFAVYLTQKDRGYWCKEVWSKLWKK